MAAMIRAHAAQLCGLLRRRPQLLLRRTPPVIRHMSTGDLGDAWDYDSATGPAKNKHRSNAEELVNKVPVIEVDRDFAVCDGGAGPLGHPVEWIQLNLAKPGVPQICKYCGLRFVKKAHSHH